MPYHQHSGTAWAALAAVIAAVPLLRAELGFQANPCPSGGTGQIVYLSSRIRGACTDAALVQSIIFEVGGTGTLIVDKACTLNAGLRLPSRFTLRGTGIGSGGLIGFQHDGIGIAMCQEPPRGYVTIADLDLYGPNAPAAITAPHSVGIVVANQNIVYITNVRVSDFHTGVSGVGSYSVFIYGSNISNNRGNNILVGYNSNGWRIRDGLVSQAGEWGINVLGPGDSAPVGSANASNDLLIDGVRMESNALGAVRTDAYGTRILNSRFEWNGVGNRVMPHRSILVDRDAAEVRILTNVFSSDCIQVENGTTQRAFNIPDDRNTAQCR